MRIWKYNIDLRGGQFANILMPAGSRVLEVDKQNDLICLWVDVGLDGSSKEKESRSFYVAATGEPVGHSGRITYLGTAHFPDRGLVWHVLELH